MKVAFYWSRAPRIQQLQPSIEGGEALRGSRFRSLSRADARPARAAARGELTVGFSRNRAARRRGERAMTSRRSDDGAVVDVDEIFQIRPASSRSAAPSRPRHWAGCSTRPTRREFAKMLITPSQSACASRTRRGLRRNRTASSCRRRSRGTSREERGSAGAGAPAGAERASRLRASSGRARGRPVSADPVAHVLLNLLGEERDAEDDVVEACSRRAWSSCQSMNGLPLGPRASPSAP